MFQYSAVDARMLLTLSHNYYYYVMSESQRRAHHCAFDASKPPYSLFFCHPPRGLADIGAVDQYVAIVILVIVRDITITINYRSRTNQNTQEVKNEHFLISTRHENNVHIFSSLSPSLHNIPFSRHLHFFHVIFILSASHSSRSCHFQTRALQGRKLFNCDLQQ